MPTKSRTPSGLKATGRRLWSQITDKFDLSAAEERLLEHAARELDLIVRIDAELASGPLFVRGSMGQDVSNPLLAEIRQHRAAYASLMAKLDLPAEPDAERTGAASRSASARELAAARWRRGA